MKKLLKVFIILLSVQTFSQEVMDRNLMEDYGSDRFSIHLKIQDFYGHRYSAKEHRVDNNELSYSPEGHMGSVSIKNDTKNTKINIPHQKWTTFSLFTTKDHNDSYKRIYSCHKKGRKILKSIDLDRQRDMALTASRLHRWIAYEEPQELLDNRMQIYQIRDLIREINKSIEKTIGKRHLALSKVYLDNLKKRAVEKIERLYTLRSSLLDKHKEWKPRTRVWVNMDYFPAKCSLPKYKG